jgi:hypothetical protein
LRSTRSNPALNEQIHHTSVKTLLKQEDMRGTPAYGFSQKFRNFKYSSQNILSKKMTALKARLGDSGIGEEIDQEVALTPRQERRRLKYKRTISDSSVMAEVLARSVLHAHNSLTCILEAQDSLQYDDEETAVDQGSVTPNTEEELEPVPNVLEKTVSEPLLSIQDNLLETHSYTGSSSSSESLSSDDDEYTSDSKEINFETVSNIVKNVELLEKSSTVSSTMKNYSKQMSLPTLSFGECQSNVTESKNGNPFVFPTTSENEEIPEDSALESDKSSSPPVEDFPDNYLETLKVPLAKIETDEESNTEDIVNDDDEEVESKSKTIIPRVRMMTSDVRHKGLFKTAMQTILLDKVNIMGTYTPPTSPTSVTTKSSAFSVASPASSSSSIQNSNNVSGRLPRSSTAVSLDCDWERKQDTVLGAPFASVYSIQRQHSIPCISDKFISSRRTPDFGLSDSALNKPETAKPLIVSCKSDQANVGKNKMSFINLLKGGGYSYSDDGNVERFGSNEQLGRKKFTFLRRTSHDPQSNLKKVRSDDLHKKRFSFLQRSKKVEKSESENTGKSFLSSIFHKTGDEKEGKDTLKKHGLLGTALGNVVMETVQDILATSQADKSKKVVEVDKKCPIFPSSSILTGTNNDNVPDVSDEASVPVNTEIDRGTSVSDNNMHASLTPSLRNNSSPVPDHPPEPGHHRAESVGTKMVQSPAKLNSVPCIYRRSSDSDLSITPKGGSKFL